MTVGDGAVRDAPAAARGALCEANLQLDLRELLERLERVLDAGDRDDAYLLACGVAQILDDRLERDVLGLARLAGRLPARPARVATRAARAGAWLRRLAPAERRVLRFRERHEPLVQACGAALVLGQPHGLRPPAGRLPAALERDVQKLPNCFRSFDQRPEDCARLVALFVERHPDPRRPLLVVGVRTSGSYLAPLFVSCLRAAGCEDVDSVTYRPGRPPLASTRRRLRRTVRRGGLVLLVDDPPRTGSALAGAAAELRRLGVPRASLVALVPLFEREPPPALAGLELVALAPEEWDVRRRLHEAGVDEIEAPPRGHARGRAGDEYVRAVGFGYFGRFGLAVAARVGAFLPRLHEHADGVLRREWLSPDARVTVADAGLARAAVAYLAACAEALRVPRDPLLGLTGREAAWEKAAVQLESCFGRLRLLVRPAARAAAVALSSSDRPAVTDGALRVGAFFVREDGSLRKVSFEDGPSATTGRGAYSFDPRFDAAGLLADAEIEECAVDGFADELRRAVEEALGPVSDEQWLLYQLVQLAIARRRAGSVVRAVAVERAVSRALQRYFAPLVRPAAPGDGPLCAVDVDGVLESRLLGAPAIGTDGALALRRLARHGFRPVLVTGRSLPELVERCRAWGLVGGAAEYGAVVYDARTGARRVLLGDDDAARLARVRAALAARPGIVVDEAYAYSVRAYRPRSDSARRCLDDDDVAAALAAAGGGVRAIPGVYQTDFAAAPDKGDGVRALRGLFDARLALAIGDSEADAPMLAEAERAFVPAHAPRTLDATRTRRPWAAGLAEASERLVGHRRCALCAPPEGAPATRLLLAALRANEGDRAAKLRQALPFALAARAVARQAASTSR